VHTASDLLSDLFLFYSKHPVFWTVLTLAVGRVVRPLRFVKHGAHRCVDNYYGFIEYCRESKARHERRVAQPTL